MDDLLTGELQPVRRAPPPPRLPPPSSVKNQSNGYSGSSFLNQLPPPLPRTNSNLLTRSRSKPPPPQPLQSVSNNKLQHSNSMPLVARNKTNSNGVSAGKKKAPPPRPPPPKINSKTQRLGGRKHDALTSGGEGVMLAGPPRSSRSSHHTSSSSAASEALLIDFSPPPRSPSLAASGSDGLSVNSFGSESSGNFFDAPTSWNMSGKAASGSDSSGGSGFANNFDPFGSIEEETRVKNESRRVEILDQFNVGGSAFYSSSIQANAQNGQSAGKLVSNLSGLGPRYDSNMFQSQDSSAFLDWSSSSASKPPADDQLPPDPFSPLRRCNTDQLAQQPPSTTIPSSIGQTTGTSNTSTAAAAAAAAPSKPRSGFRATIIRPKLSPEESANGSSSSSSSSGVSRLKSSVQHSTSSPTALSSLGGYSDPPPASHIPLARTDDVIDAPLEVLGSLTPSPGDFNTDNLSLSSVGTSCSGRQEGTYAVAEFDYDSSEPGDLCLKVGDRVELVAAISDDWLEGRLHGKQGLFPTAFVKMVGVERGASPCAASIPEQQQPPLASNQAVALYSFTAEQPSDLMLQEGDVVTVCGVVEGGQWLLGDCAGRSGQFPANFVSRVPANLPVITL